jgi:hypothetical protein
MRLVTTIHQERDNYWAVYRGRSKNQNAWKATILRDNVQTMRWEVEVWARADDEDKYPGMSNGEWVRVLEFPLDTPFDTVKKAMRNLLRLGMADGPDV